MARTGRGGRSRRREKQSSTGATIKIVAILAAFLLIGVFVVRAMLAQKELDPETLCPPVAENLTVLVVDVTDPLNLPQRQDFLNQLDRLSRSIPQYGKLVIYKVDPISDRLLEPVITKCNPGTAQDVSDIDGNPGMTQKKWEDEFEEPLKRAFSQVIVENAADRSPILESIQSISLTEVPAFQEEQKPIRLIVASDLLQNTDKVSFYGGLPAAAPFLESQEFRGVATDLRGVDVELWMLQRSDSASTQPRALINLWDQIISEQGATVSRVYNVSG